MPDRSDYTDPIIPQFPHGTRVRARGGPYESPCPGCGRKFGATAPDITGTVWSGPTTVLVTCRTDADGIGCGRQQLFHGIYHIDADDPPGRQGVPWHLVEPI